MLSLLSAWGLEAAVTVRPMGEEPSRAFLVETADGVAPLDAARRFVLKQKVGVWELELEAWLLSSLAAQGAPVAPPLPTCTGENFALWDAAPGEPAPYCLYPYVPGDIVEDHYGPSAWDRAVAYGGAIGLLHRGLRRLPRRKGFPVMELAIQIFGNVRDTLLSEMGPPLPPWLADIYAVLDRELVPHYAELPQQLIHRDPHPANMVFSDGEVTSFIDFELATWGVRIFDLAYCSTSLLSAAGDDLDLRSNWFDLLTALVGGYVTVQPLLPVEFKLFWHVQLSIQLIFIAFFYDVGNSDLAELNAGMLHWLYGQRSRVYACMTIDKRRCSDGS